MNGQSEKSEVNATRVSSDVKCLFSTWSSRGNTAVCDILAGREQIKQPKIEKISAFVWMKDDVGH